MEWSKLWLVNKLLIALILLMLGVGIPFACFHAVYHDKQLLVACMADNHPEWWCVSQMRGR
jgi:hypothetical protein